MGSLSQRKTRKSLAAQRRINRKAVLACGPTAHQQVDRFPSMLQDEVLQL